MAETDPLPPLRTERPHWGRWVAFALLVLAAILVIQNSQTVEVEFLFATIDTPLAFALLVALGIGALVGWLVPRVRR